MTTEVNVEGGKYTFIVWDSNGRVEVLRFGEPWIREMTTGSKALIALVCELEAARNELAEIKRDARLIHTHKVTP